MKDERRKPFLTLIFIREEGGGVKRLRLTKNAVRWTIASAIAVFLLVSLAFMDYLSAKFDNVHLRQAHQQTMENNARLLRENQVKAAQIDALTGKVGAISSKLDRMAQIDRSIRELTNLGPAEGVANTGVGGDGEEILAAMRSSEGEKINRIDGALDALTGRADGRLASLESLQEELAGYEGALVSVPSIWPVRGWVSSDFGYRTSPFTGQRAFHHGIDVATAEGTAIIAPANGIVEFLGVKGGYGTTLLLRHGGGIVTLYGHLQASLVRKGQAVRRGDRIALVGNTGRSTGPHLHYEIRLNDVPVNPRRYIIY